MQALLLIWHDLRVVEPVWKLRVERDLRRIGEVVFKETIGDTAFSTIVEGDFSHVA